MAAAPPVRQDPSDPFSPTVVPSEFHLARTKNRFLWSSSKRLAAQLLGSGDWLDSEVADRIGVARGTITRWRMHPSFLAGIASHAEAASQELINQGIAIKERRLADYEHLNLLLNQIREERATAALIEIEHNSELASVGGFRTGLIVRQDKVIGTGSNAQKTTEYKIDKGWFDAKLELHKQMAQETGQWTTLTHITGNVDVKMTVEDIRAAIYGPQITDVTADYKELSHGHDADSDTGS